MNPKKAKAERKIKRDPEKYRLELETREYVTRIMNLQTEQQFLKKSLDLLKQDERLNRRIHKRQGFKQFEV